MFSFLFIMFWVPQEPKCPALLLVPIKSNYPYLFYRSITCTWKVGLEMSTVILTKSFEFLGIIFTLFKKYLKILKWVW